jgi:hypothetical protein
VAVWAGQRLFGSGASGGPKAQQTFRLLGNIMDQGLSSLTNLLVSLFSAHLLRVEEFGVVSVVMTTYFVCVGVARAMVGDPLLLSRAQPKALPKALPRETVSQVASASFGIGLLFTLATLALWAVDSSNGLVKALVVLSVGMPLLLLQDVARYIEFWRGSPWGAAANDLLWLVGSLGALLLLPRQYASTATVLACWVGSGAFAGVVFAIYLKWRPSAPAAWSWVSGNRRLIMPMLGDYGLIALLQQGTIYVITAIAGLRATAAFRGALVALGPVNVLTAGVSVFLVQLGRRSYEATPKKLPIIMLRRSAAMSAAVLTLCIAVYFMPTKLGELLLGDIWERARPLILPFSFVFATAALNFGATTGLRLIGEAGRSFRIRAVAAPLMLIAVAVACIHRGVTAAVWAQAITGLVATSMWWWKFVASHRQKFPQLTRDRGPRHRR